MMIYTESIFVGFVSAENCREDGVLRFPRTNVNGDLRGSFLH